jgi:hypothetical protein
VFTWSQPASSGWQACSSGPYCLTGYVLYEISTGTPVAVATAPEGSLSLTITPQPSIGSHSYELAQTGLDQNGVPVQSTRNTGVVINCRKNGTGRLCVMGKHW